MNDPTLAFIFLFWHATLKEIRNVDTLVSAVHTFLTSLNLFTQPFFQGESDRGRVRAVLQKEAEKEWQRRRENEKRIWGWENRGRRGFGSWGRKERGDWGQRKGNERQGAFPHQIRSDMPNWGLCASGGRFRMRSWNFLNAAFEKAQSSKFVFILPHQTD